MARPKNQTFYLGNKNLPEPDTTFQWTPDMVEELEKCRKSVIHFAKYFYIINLDEGKQVIKLYPYQKRILKALVENRFNVVLASRQIGKTTVLTIFALWQVCFNEDYRVLLIANKQETAKNIFKRVKIAYEMLPNFLKPGVVTYAKEGMELGNGSSIGISTTTSDAARGESINCLLLDEAAHIPSEFMDDFWESVFPVITKSKKSKIFMLSTPNGVGNLFYNIYTDATTGKNGWHHDRVDWFDVPGQDEKWKATNLALLGSQAAFDQEYGNIFRAAGENAMDAEQLKTLEEGTIDPIMTDEDGAYKIYKDREPKHFYSIGVDVGEGIGRANSTIQVIDITDLTCIEQVATFASNRLDPFNFAGKLAEIAHEWGSPPLVVERNNCGAQVVDALIHTHHYESLIKYTPSMGSYTEKADREHRMGVFSHTNSKYSSMVNLRYWMNVLACVKIYDKDTVNEFKTYVRNPNGTWKKQSDKYLDDRVEALIWALFAIDAKVVEQFYEVLQSDSNGKPMKVLPIDWDPYSSAIAPTRLDNRYGQFKKYRDDKSPLGVRNPAMMTGGDLNRDSINPDMDQLLVDGWKPMRGSVLSRPNASQESDYSGEDVDAFVTKYIPGRRLE
jgi:hypothetical protein